jgi:hypothetical protein
MRPRRTSWPLALAVFVAMRAHAAPCPTMATLTVVADNRSADAAVDIHVTGTRLASAGSCDPAGTGLADSFDVFASCSGAGPSICGHVQGLAPGLWIYRLSTQVLGSPAQIQAQRGVVLGGTGSSNVVEWTIFGRTFVVTQATGANFKARVDDAIAYTAANPQPALVRFDPAPFPGAATPKTLTLQSSCALDTCNDGRETAYCFEGSDVTVDALDANADPGGVVLSVGTCNNSLLRLYGTDDVLRGLVLQGTTDPMPGVAVDTIAIAGLASGGNRLEQCTVVGPTLGDAVAVEGDAAQPGSGPAGENAIVASEVRGAEDKGIKVDFGGVLRLERTCVHDNRNGGVQVTLGGTATAIENVVQHNAGGSAGNGIFSGVPNVQDSQFPNALTTQGNVVRFNGARGISVVNNGTATLADDVVTDNYRAGLRVETTVTAVVPTATVRGSTFACNYAPGACLNTGAACRQDDECTLQLCGASGAATGVGVAFDQPCVGCALPDVDLGVGGADSGRNAFTLNANPASVAPGGVNVMSEVANPSGVPAAGNQWEHCDVPMVDPDNPNKCNIPQVQTYDVRGAGATDLSLGNPTGPRHGVDPVVTSISPGRPRAGDLVRVYGGPFNAIDGAACHPPGLPADRCSAANPAVVTRNASDVSQGNHVTVTIGGTPYAADVQQVTPTMLAFTMPVDCWAPATLVVARGNDVAAPAVLCDPGGCTERPPGALCNDDDFCTTHDACDGVGACVGVPLDCAGACLTGACLSGLCVPSSASAPCTDGDVCTLGDHCSGSGDVCVPGAPRVCAGACLTGDCDAALGCLVRDATAACDDGNACTEGDHCSGVDDTCVASTTDCDDHESCTTDSCDAASSCSHVARPDGTPCPDVDPCRGPAGCLGGTCDQGAPVGCDDGRACTDDTCAAARGCVHFPRFGLDGVVCHVAQLQALLDAMPSGLAGAQAALAARVGCIDRRVAAAASAADPSKPRVRNARRARRCAVRFLDRSARIRRLDETSRAAFRDEAEAARTAIESFFGL